jgi:UDP-3-O-[3-hydroxymyristoyl] glucosamine N-acyltransferase
VFDAVFEFTLRELVTELGGELIGNPDGVISEIGTLETARPCAISFLSNPRYKAQLSSSQAGCVIVHEAQREMAVARGTTLVVSDPYLYFAKLTQWWVSQVRPKATTGVHPSAIVDPSARIDSTASIGPLVVIEANVVIAGAVVIGAQSFIGAGSTVGFGTRFASRVTFYSDCHVGERCLLHSGVVVGADGFGFAPTQGRYEKIEQLGGVRIGSDVEIGANTCIDRGALEDTVIEDGVKLDNLIQIGHNVQIGAHAAMAGCVGVAGSTRIGKGCTVGGAAMILGHLELASGVHISAASVVSRSINQPGQYSGFFPIDENASWEKNAVILRNLNGIRDRIRRLEKENKS